MRGHRGAIRLLALMGALAIMGVFWTARAAHASPVAPRPLLASGYGDDSFSEPPSRPDEDPDEPSQAPRPAPTEAPPGPPPAMAPPSVPFRPAGPLAPTRLVFRAAGRIFRIPGLVLGGSHSGMVRIGAPDFDALLALYGVRLRWEADRRAAAFLEDGQTTLLPVGVQDLTLPSSSRTHVAVPLLEWRGDAYLPVALLPAMLQAKLQALSLGQYQLDPLVTGFGVEAGPGGGARLTIACRVPMHWTSFMLHHPDRYVLNLPNAVLDLERYHEAARRMVSIPEVGRVRFDQFSFLPNVVRVVIPLGDNREVHVLPRSTPHHLVVAISTAAASLHAENFARQRITSMHVDRGPHGIRIVLRGSGPFQYEWHRLKPPDNRFFLDITQAVLAGPRRAKPADDGYVSEVELGQFEQKPVPTVRLKVDLARAADTRVYTRPGAPNVLVIEVHHRTVALNGGNLRGFGATRMPSGHRVVCIDPGHGGDDPGAINRALGIAEKDVTLDVARRLAALLRRQGWQVVMTRNSDRDVSYPGSSASEELGARVRVARDFHADLFVCIHCNSSADHSAIGTSTHWYKSTDRLLARFLQPQVVRALNSPNRGLQRNRYYVLRNTRMPAVLIEAGFISNHGEGRKLESPMYRERIAEGIAEGLDRYLAHVGGARTGQRRTPSPVSAR